MVSGGASTSSSDCVDEDDNAGAADEKGLGFASSLKALTLAAKALTPKETKENEKAIENEKVIELRDRLLEASGLLEPRENATLMTPALMLEAINELSGFPMTINVLLATQVGKAVKKLCKHKEIDGDVQAAAKELIVKWKKTTAEEKEREEAEEKEREEREALAKKALKKKALDKKALAEQEKQKALDKKALAEQQKQKALGKKPLKKALAEQEKEQKTLGKKALAERKEQKLEVTQPLEKKRTRASSKALPEFPASVDEPRSSKRTKSTVFR